MREPPGLHWHYRVFRGERFDVRFVAPRQCQWRGVLCFGRTILNRREILLSVMQAKETIGKTYLHESLHAIAGNEKCERFICSVESGLWSLVTECGFKLPRLPNGFEEFRAESMFANGELLCD